MRSATSAGSGVHRAWSGAPAAPQSKADARAAQRAARMSARARELAHATNELAKRIAQIALESDRAERATRDPFRPG